MGHRQCKERVIILLNGPYQNTYSSCELQGGNPTSERSYKNPFGKEIEEGMNVSRDITHAVDFLNS